MRRHWQNCLTHFDTGVDDFVDDYFGQADRRCLLVAAAGFDPRARLVTEKLARTMGDRLSALFIREERGNPAASLQAAADSNEAELQKIVATASVARIPIFAEDGAPVGGVRIGEALARHSIAKEVTDVVLDMSALSIGVGYPAARHLLTRCEATAGLSFHVMIASNPELDAKIFAEPTDRAMNVRGFAGGVGPGGDASVARIWLPQLAHRSAAALGKIRAANDDVYKICPILPFPARNPRRPDELIEEYGAQLRDEWQVDARDIIYVSERNPLDSYRTISTLKHRYDRTVSGVYVPQIILSPIGSKVMAAGAMMAAIEHDLTVQYVETLRYEFDQAAADGVEPTDMIVHIWLHGPVYAEYNL
jgi:hypothetical protein